MASLQSDVRTTPATGQPSIQRRGLFAAAAAFVVGLVAKRSEEPVFAGTDGDVVLGASNSTSSVTSIANSTANSTAMQLSASIGLSGQGLASFGSYVGVHGVASVPLNVINTGGIVGAGVLGESTRANSAGVWGNNAHGGVGVRGDSDTSSGIFGQSMSGVPIFAQVAPGSNANTMGLYALNMSSYTGGSPGAGGFGVYGLCLNGHGLVGAVATAGAAAVVGATNGVPNAFAGAFYGPVIVGGNFTVFGAKSAAVPHPDGTHRRLYCVESPESWFEDFGKGQLECGRAEVTIDKDFAAVARLDDYHVFLTPYGAMDVLSVTAQTPEGFRVEASDPTSRTRFSWRIVAKRADIPAPRFEAVSVPPEPAVPPVPEVVTSAPVREQARAAGR